MHRRSYSHLDPIRGKLTAETFIGTFIDVMGVHRTDENDHRIDKIDFLYIFTQNKATLGFILAQLKPNHILY